MKQVVMTATYIHSEIQSMVADSIKKSGYTKLKDELQEKVYDLIDPAKDEKILGFRDPINRKGNDNLYDISILDYFTKKLKEETNSDLKSIPRDYTIIDAISKVHEWKLRVLLLYCVEYTEALKIKIQHERY